MVLVAQQMLRRASLYVGPSMRGICRMCLDSVGMHDIYDSCMRRGSCRRLTRFPLLCTLEVLR